MGKGRFTCSVTGDTIIQNWNEKPHRNYAEHIPKKFPRRSIHIQHDLAHHNSTGSPLHLKLPALSLSSPSSSPLLNRKNNNKNSNNNNNNNNDNNNTSMNTNSNSNNNSPHFNKKNRKEYNSANVLSTPSSTATLSSGGDSSSFSSSSPSQSSSSSSSDDSSFEDDSFDGEEYESTDLQLIGRGSTNKKRIRARNELIINPILSSPLSSSFPEEYNSTASPPTTAPSTSRRSLSF